MSNPEIQVFQKDLHAAQFTFAPKAGVFLLTEVITSVALVSTTPTTTPPLVASNPVVTGAGLSFMFDAAGGVDGATYGVQILATTSLMRNLLFTAAVHVVSDVTTSYVTKNPYAYQSLIGELEAGDAAVGKAMFFLSAGTDTSGGYVTWELIDVNGSVYSSGNAIDFLATPDSFHTLIEANAVIHVPATVPPTLADQKYQIRWFLHNTPPGSTQPLVQSENLVVLGNTSVPIGAADNMEMYGDVAEFRLVVPRPYGAVGVSLYKGNSLIGTITELRDNKPVASGWMYTAVYDTTSGAAAALDPYTVSWRCSDSTHPVPDRYTAQLFVVNPTMMEAINDVQRLLMKARTTLRQDSDFMFDPVTIMGWLRRGRDYFNAAGGILTAFTMTNASGPIREFWLRYSEVAALQAQYLLEGEKSFNFSGSDISLDVDHSQFYQSMANDLLQSVNDTVATLKKNLQIKGVNGGDGNFANIGGGSARNMGVVGVSRNAISPRPPMTGGLNWTNR